VDGIVTDEPEECARQVGLHKFANPVDPQLESVWFQPFLEPIKCKTGFKVCFRKQLVPLQPGGGVARRV
jgi:hypothetical protein